MLGILAVNEIREKYNESPKEWYYFLSTDKTNKFLEILLKNQNIWIISRKSSNSPYSESVYNRFESSYPLQSTVEVKEFGVRYLDSKIDELDDEFIDKILKDTEPEKFSGIKNKDIFFGPIYTPFLKKKGYNARKVEIGGNNIHVVYEKMVLIFDVSKCVDSLNDMSKIVDKRDEKNKVGPMFG